MTHGYYCTLHLLCCLYYGFFLWRLLSLLLETPGAGLSGQHLDHRSGILLGGLLLFLLPPIQFFLDLLLFIIPLDLHRSLVWVPIGTCPVFASPILPIGWSVFALASSTYLGSSDQSFSSTPKPICLAWSSETDAQFGTTMVQRTGSSQHRLGSADTHSTTGSTTTGTNDPTLDTDTTSTHATHSHSSGSSNTSTMHKNT